MKKEGENGAPEWIRTTDLASEGRKIALFYGVYFCLN